MTGVPVMPTVGVMSPHGQVGSTAPGVPTRVDQTTAPVAADSA